MTHSNIPTVPTSNAGSYYPVGGLNSVPEYMAPGFPFSKQVTAITGSATRVDFPMVTNEIHVKNNSASTIAIGWTENGTLGSNRYTLKEDQDVTFNFRVKTIYLVVVSGATPSNIDVTAGLTQLFKAYYPEITGSAARADGYISTAPVHPLQSGSLGVMGYDGIG